MFWNILRRDLKRKKTMNIILLLFIVLASVFVASSVNNITSVVGGLDKYLEMGGIGDISIIGLGDGVDKSIRDAFEGESCVTELRMDDKLLRPTSNVEVNGVELEDLQNVIVMPLSESEFTYFDEQNERVTDVPKGKCLLTVGVMDKFGLKAGDRVKFCFGDNKYEFEIAGGLKDAMLGSVFMGNPRFALNAEDFNEIWDETGDSRQAFAIASLDTNDTDKVNEILSTVTGVQVFPFSIIKLTYVLDMLTALIMLVASIALIIVSFVVLRFAVNLSVNEEIREIGIMKAIGLKDRRIRGMFLVKYLALSIVGTTIGFIASIPFSSYLLKSSSRNMVLTSTGGIVIPLVSSFVVLLAIVGYAYLCTRRVRKYAPIDAIREGQSGERFKKKSGIRIGKSPLNATGFLALNDILSSPRKYITVVIAFSICTTIVLTLINSVETLRSDNLAYSFGKVTDVYLTETGDDHTIMVKADLIDVLDNLEKRLGDEGLDVETSMDALYSASVSFNGKDYNERLLQGINITADEYVYYEGSAPASIDEIAITEQIREKTGASIGDYMDITINGETRAYQVTAYFETMNNTGSCIRVHEDVNIDNEPVFGFVGYQLDFKDNPDQKTIDTRICKIKDILGTQHVYNAAEFVDHCTNSSDTMEQVAHLFLGITLIVVVMMSILMERSFIADEKSEIAIMKAVGFKDSRIIAHHVKRFMMVAVTAIILAVIFSIPITEISITPIFRSMGMKNMTFEYNLLKIGLIYPAIVLGVTLLTVSLTALYSKTITSRNTALSE